MQQTLDATDVEPASVDPWLTKTDVKLARWCMNAFLAHREGLLAPIHQRSARSQALVEAGTTFDELTRARSRAEALDLPDLFTVEGQLKDPDMPLLAMNSELLVNTTLELRGIPDALVWEHGCWYPVEVKNHTTMTRSDAFELAFYWRLMAPMQDPEVLQPAAGWLLPSDGNGGPGEPVSAFIPGHVFRELDWIIADCRDALQAGRRAGWCDCWLCRDMTPEAREQRRALAPVMMIPGVGEARVALLREHGYHTVGDLLTRRPRRLLPGGERRRGISLRAMEELAWRAQVFLDDVPVALSDPVPGLPEQYVALDLEYDDQEMVVWMATLRTAGTGADERITVCGDWSTQVDMGTAIEEFLTRHPDLPILTWGGTTADMPRLEFLIGDLQPVLERHLDAHRWLKQHWAMPLKSTGLKDLARYYGIEEPPDGLIGGFLAPWIWRSYQLDPAAHRDEFNALVEYNQWDVNTLVELCTAFRLLPHMPKQPTPHVFASDQLLDYTLEANHHLT